MPMIPTPNFTPGRQAHLATDRHDFELHLEGQNPPNFAQLKLTYPNIHSFRHTADQIDATITIDGYTYTDVNSALQVLATNSISSTAGGDLTGTYPNPSVKGLLSHTLPTLSAGNLTYSGSIGWEFTQYPTSLPPSGSALGDLGGSYPTPAVVGLQGHRLPAPTNNGSTQYLTYTSAGLLAWGAGGSVIFSGDLTGNSSSQQVAQISSATGSINFASNNTAPVISQLSQTSNTVTNSLSISGQSAFASATGANQLGGSISVSAGKSASGNQGSGLLFGGGSNTAASTSSELLIDNLNIYDTVTPRPDLRFVINASSTPSFYPGQNNVGTLGTSSHNWNNIYSSSLTISGVGSNAILLGEGSFVAPNSSHDTEVLLSVNGNLEFQTYSIPNLTDITTEIIFDPANTTSIITQTTQTSNTPTNAVSIVGQSAYASATGSNQSGGTVSFSGGKSANGNQGAGILFGGGSNTAASTTSELIIDTLTIYDTLTPRPDSRFVISTSATPSIYPSTNNTGTLGTSSHNWQNIYTETITVSNVGSNAVLCGEGSYAAPNTDHDTELLVSVSGNLAFTSTSTLVFPSINVGTYTITDSSGNATITGPGGAVTELPNGVGTKNSQYGQYITEMYFGQNTGHGISILATITMPSGNRVIQGTMRSSCQLSSGGSNGAAIGNFVGHSDGTTATFDITPSAGLVSGSLFAGTQGFSASSLLFSATSGNRFQFGFDNMGSTNDITIVLEYIIG